MSEDMLNVMGSFISTELDAFENLHKELEEKDKEIERLTKRLREAQLGYLAVEEKNKKLHSIIKEVREYIDNEVIVEELNSSYTYITVKKEDILEILDKENSNGR